MDVIGNLQRFWFSVTHSTWNSLGQPLGEGKAAAVEHKRTPGSFCLRLERVHFLHETGLVQCIQKKVSQPFSMRADADEIFSCLLQWTVCGGSMSSYAECCGSHQHAHARLSSPSVCGASGRLSKEAYARQAIVRTFALSCGQARVKDMKTLRLPHCFNTTHSRTGPDNIGCTPQRDIYTGGVSARESLHTT